MKKIYTLFLALIFAGSLMAQTPQNFKYQAVARDASGDVVANQPVGMQISILQSSTSGIAVYVETFASTTNEFGLMNLNIGAGTVVSGDFTTIDWSSETYFVKVEMDITGGTTYEEYGTSQLLSVPYAMHAKTAENLTGTVTETDPLFTAWDKTTGINITESQISDLDHFTNTDETDQIFTASVANNITTSDTTRWGSTGGTEADPLFTAWDKSTDISITESQITDLDHFTTADEIDPIFGVHAANGITPTNITNWTTAFSWGDHSLGGYFAAGGEAGGTNRTLGNTDDYSLGFKTNDATRLFITNDGNVGIGTTSPATMLDVNGVITASGGDSDDWNTAFGWGDHSGVYRPIGYVPAWSEITSKPTTITGFGITDAMNTSHAANAITSTNITNWNTAYTDRLKWDGGATGLVAATGRTSLGLGSLATLSSINNSNWSGDDLVIGRGGTGASNKADARANLGLAIGANVQAYDEDLTDLADGTLSASKVQRGTYFITSAGTSGQVWTSDGTGRGVWATTKHYIGESYGGGKVFWVDETGEHGLIAATTDQSTGILWYNGSNTTTNAVRDGIYAGQYITERIITNQGTGSYAAQLCANYKGGNYGDWYLPSKYELNLMYLQKAAIGVFASSYYWSSTEHNINVAWRQDFGSGNQTNYLKNYAYYVRAVRAF